MTAVPALTEADRDTYRTEIDRLTAELAKYVGHEPTIAEELACQCEALDQAEALAEQVREYWIPQPGHPAGDVVGVSVHTLDGLRWAVRHESILGMRAWTADGWTPPLFVVSKEVAYCWGRDKALAQGFKVAEMLARQAAALTVRDFTQAVEETVVAAKQLAEQVSA
jgi:hypothetical protein